MRVLHIIASANPDHGGVIEGAVKIGEVLAQGGHHQDLMTLDAPDETFLDRVPATVVPLGMPDGEREGVLARLRRRFHMTPHAIPWLRTHLDEYDVVIVAGLWNYAILVARRVLVGGHTPYVVFTHGMLDPWFAKTYPLKTAVKRLLWLVNERVLLKHAARVLFTCEEERRLASKTYKPYRATEFVIGFGTADVTGDPQTQIDAFKTLLPAVRGRRFLLFLSRLHEKKGCDLLIEAFGGVARDRPELDLVMAGPDQQGLKDTLIAQAEALGIAERVHWPGMVGGDAKWGAFRACEAFVLPSHQENFGVVTAEAMACSRPVLTTDKVNIWREIETDGAGLIVPDTIDGVRDGLTRLLAMTDEDRQAMGVRGRQSFLKRFRVETFVAGLEDVLNDVIAENRVATAGK